MAAAAAHRTWSPASACSYPGRWLQRQGTESAGCAQGLGCGEGAARARPLTLVVRGRGTLTHRLGELQKNDCPSAPHRPGALLRRQSQRNSRRSFHGARRRGAPRWATHLHYDSIGVKVPRTARWRVDLRRCERAARDRCRCRWLGGLGCQAALERRRLRCKAVDAMRRAHGSVPWTRPWLPGPSSQRQRTVTLGADATLHRKRTLAKQFGNIARLQIAACRAVAFRSGAMRPAHVPRMHSATPTPPCGHTPGRMCAMLCTFTCAKREHVLNWCGCQICSGQCAFPAAGVAQPAACWLLHAATGRHHRLPH